VLGVPTETSAERTQQTYAGLSDVLKDGFTRDAQIFRAESYGALAIAVESGKVDAAFLPGASTYALLKRTKLGVDVLAQAQFHGATTYSGVLVAREGLKQRALPSRRVGEIREAGALTEVETNTEAERLFGTRMAFVQMDSLSGYLAPASWLGQRGVRMTDLGEVIFAQTHTRALSLLRSGRVDVAATFDRVLMEAQAEDPTFKPEILARFDGLPNALLVTRPGMPLERREHLLQVLSSVFDDAERSQAREALETGAAMDGLVPASVDAVREVGKWLE
jgi:ABC-type phosphate/phosphonate transport system substrate-binding protein